MSIWWEENFNLLKPGDLDTKGGWNKVADTSGGALSGTIISRNIIHQKTLRATTSTGNGLVRYEKSVLAASQYEFSFRTRILTDVPGGDVLTIALYDGGTPAITIGIIPGKVGPISPVVSIANGSGTVSTNIPLFQIANVKVIFDTKYRLFVNGVLIGSLNEFGGSKNVDTVRLEVLKPALDPAGQNRIHVDDFLGELVPVTPLILDFEPPEYTMTGGPGGTPELDTQDAWIRNVLAGAGTGNMEITNNVSKVLGETQSLEVNWGDFGEIVEYTRIIPPETNLITQFVFKFDPSPHPGQQFNVQGMTTTSGPGSAWYYGVRGDGANLFLTNADASSTLLPPLDLSLEHLVVVTVEASVGSASITIDGQLVDSRVILPNSIQRIKIEYSGQASAVGGAVPVYIDNMVLQVVPEVPEEQDVTPKPPQNVIAIRRENYIVVSWDTVTEGVNETKLEGGVIRYDVFRSNNLNETDSTLIASIESLDANGKVDTVFVDTGKENMYVYRVKAIAFESQTVLESELSEGSEAIKLSAQIDDKSELIDRKLFALNKSILGEGILS